MALLKFAVSYILGRSEQHKIWSLEGKIVVEVITAQTLVERLSGFFWQGAGLWKALRMNEVFPECQPLLPPFRAALRFWWKRGLFISKAAVVTFCGAYAVLPYVSQVALGAWWLLERRKLGMVPTLAACALLGLIWKGLDF